MAVEFIPIDRDTPLRWPPCIQDDLPERHLARFVVEIVDPLDWRARVEASRGTGSPPDPPAMLALLFDGSATGL